MVEIRALCVFCGSSTPPDPRYGAAARALGTFIAERGIELVYGGGRVGLMGEVAGAALAAGGRVTGVIPVGLFSREIGHTGLTKLHEVGSMHERKQLMYDLSDGFIALPGGLGTLDELAEVTTWAQLGLHAKPVVLLDVDGFWDMLVAQFDLMVRVGLLRQANCDLVRRADTPQQALDALLAPRPAGQEKWITPGDR
ncbi:MAG TPA: TIGR00730 family Rossman fold protein [Streptosporangiaceae bacterium]|nr:TIGR00730 family Rossman fold protein [Streptosporangiaceae bacterium]